MARVLVLNATYEPINVCTLRRAAVLLLKQKAELLEQPGVAALVSVFEILAQEGTHVGIDGAAGAGLTSDEE